MLETVLAGLNRFYPALEIVHILGIALLFGGLMVFELRVLGLSQALPAPALARLTLPLALLGFALCAVSGTAMLAGQVQELLANPALRLKFVLIALAGLNAAWFHRRGGSARLDSPGRLLCLLSLGFWIAVIICGRLIAYV